MKQVFLRSFLSFLVIFQALNLTAQTGLNPGNCETALAYFDDFTDGYVILRDGTRIDGEISIKKYEKEGRITITDRSKQDYKLDVRSLRSWGLNINAPKCYSPLSWFDWKNQKRRTNDHAERGFVVLTNGETKDGKIRIEGSSYDGAVGGENYFAIEKLTFTDKSGQETTYTRDQMKGYGRILPWMLTPPECYSWQSGEFMGKRKTKFKPGYCITNDGKRIEGNMQLIVKNKLPRTKGNSNVNIDKTRSDIVDEIRFERSGKDERIDLDDVFAYGLSDMTINTLTNNRDRVYNMAEMNFHQATVTTTDNKTMKGMVAYFPEPGNYYGVYYATRADEPVTIIPLKDIQKVDQEISVIEPFDDGTVPAKKSNNSINGYVMTTQMKKFEGTVKLIEDNDFWCRSIEFTDKDGNTLKYGGDKDRLAYFVMNNTFYAQHESVFMKAEKMGSPMVIYNNPFPDNSTKGDRFASMLGKELVRTAVREVVTRATWDLQMNYGISMKDVKMNGKSQNDLNFAFNAGNMAADGLVDIMFKSARAKERLPYKAKRGEDMFILNILTGETFSSKDDDNWDVLLEGCSKYLSLSSKEQKAIHKSGNAAMADYINTCYGK